jgi:hypothetical protein
MLRLWAELVGVAGLLMDFFAGGFTDLRAFDLNC